MPSRRTNFGQRGASRDATYAVRNSLNMRAAAVLLRWSWYSSRSASTGSTSKTTVNPSARSDATPGDRAGSPGRTPATGHGFLQSASRPRASLNRLGPHEGSAIDHEGVAGHEAARIGAQEVGHRADVELRSSGSPLRPMGQFRMNSS